MANTLQDKTKFDALSNLIRLRGSERAKEKQRSCEELSSTSSIWERKPIDFSPRLYQPKPPKRNSKEAMKPWKYGSKETCLLTDKKTQKHEIEKPPLDLSEYLSEKTNIDWLQDENQTDFQSSFRLLTANRARIEASKTMGFRDGLDQYKNPMPHDFRGLKNLYGMPEFKTKFRKDVYNIKFLSENLNIITGLEGPLEMRHVDEGLQIGELKKTPEPKYLPNLILPKLPYPNRFYGYTRYRPENRSVASAYWDRVLPILNEKWKKEKQQQPYEFL